MSLTQAAARTGGMHIAIKEVICLPVVPSPEEVAN
jgi:hypothetical protein